MLEPLIGRNSVILLDEAPHLEQRKLLLPAFHGEKMQRLIGLMTELTEREVDTWPREQPVALHPRLQRLDARDHPAHRVRARAGRQQLERLRDVLTDVLAFTENPLSVLPPVQRVMGRFGPTKRFEQQKARADALIFELIEERRAERRAEGRPSATTSSRCCSRPATTMARRCRRRSCATS